MPELCLDELSILLLQAESDDDVVLDELQALLAAHAADIAGDERLAVCVEAVVAALAPSPRPPGTLGVIRDAIERAASSPLFESAAKAQATPAMADATEMSSPDGEIVVVAASDADRSLLSDFISESRECLQASEAALLRVEADPGDSEAINTIFRGVHTIKGTSGFLGLDALSDLAHTAESLLMEIRDGRLKPTPSRANLIFRAIDVLGAVLDGIAVALRGERATLPSGYRELLAELRRLEADGYPAEEELKAAPARATEAPKREASAPAEAMVRVRTERLDRLVDMVGELVIAQSMLSQDDVVRSPGRQALSRKVTHAAKIVRELQDLSMGMRMVPLKGPFQKVARLARDLAQRNNKIVEFVSDGEDTEIDRNLVDVLADPLVHMVRNSLDHGLEPPEDRVRAGKPAHGTLRLSAHHAGGNVVVEIEDDGRGLNPQRIVAKARERGLIETGEGLSVADIQNLIFHPGFSTADAVTEVSGRGVGMDVVRRNVEAMRGRIDIDSTPGVGTKFTIKLPLTLAITDGMLVRVGEERYLVPTIHIRLSFRPERSQLATVAGRGELVVMRGEPIPIVRLHRVFGIPNAVEDAANGLLMIVGDSRSSVAVLVDDLLGQQQVVAKSLGDAIGRIPGLAGGAILGDGRVGLILDVTELNGLARRGAAIGDALARGAA